MPITDNDTKRQKLTTSSGVEIERKYIYLPANYWASLYKLSIIDKSSISLVIQSFADKAYKELEGLTDDKT